MSTRSGSSLSDVALIAVFAGLLAAFTLAPAVPVGPLGVPITLQTLAVALCGLILGAWRGALAVLLYLAVGLAGLPVFAQGNAGLGVLARPSIGYLLAFPVAALVIGLLARVIVRRVTPAAGRTAAFTGAVLVATVAVIYPLGIAGLHLVGGLDWDKAFAANLVYLPGDIVKCVVAAVVAVAVHKAFPDLMVHPAVASTPAAKEPATRR